VLNKPWLFVDYIFNFRYVKEGIVRPGTSLFVKVALTLLVYFPIISEVITFCGIKLAAFLHFIICAADTVTLIV
jgi:hypothetical protein